VAFYNSSARTPRKTPSSVAKNVCLLVRYLLLSVCFGNIFIEPLPSNGHMRHNMNLHCHELHLVSKAIINSMFLERLLYIHSNMKCNIHRCLTAVAVCQPCLWTTEIIIYRSTEPDDLEQQRHESSDPRSSPVFNKSINS
jgi:hypothetical protein